MKTKQAVDKYCKKCSHFSLWTNLNTKSSLKEKIVYHWWCDVNQKSFTTQQVLADGFPILGISFIATPGDLDLPRECPFNLEMLLEEQKC